MNKNNSTAFIITIMMIMFSIAGFAYGFVIGKCKQNKDNHELLKKLGIEIVETRVFNSEPEYSYRIVDVKKEQTK